MRGVVVDIHRFWSVSAEGVLHVHGHPVGTLSHGPAGWSLVETDDGVRVRICAPAVQDVAEAVLRRAAGVGVGR